MRHPLLTLAAILAGFMLSAQPQAFSPAFTPESAGFSSVRLQRLDAFLQEWVRSGKAPQLVALVERGGQVAFHRAYGVRNLETGDPARPDDLFRLASQTKLVTTVAAMMLYEEGKFLLDDPVASYLPEFSKPRILVSHDPKTGKYQTRPASRPLTVRHLLTHTAGIPYEHPLDGLPEFQVPFFNALEPITLEQMVRRLAARPLLHEPGEAFTYGLGTDILGRLVEVWSGQPLAGFFAERIFAPLGMRDTWFYLPGSADRSRLVELYEKPDAGKPLALSASEANRSYGYAGAQTFYSGGAGLIGTAEDYARLCRMLLNGGTFNGHRLLSPATVAYMTQHQTGDLRVWDRQDGFSFGLQVVRPETRYGDPAPPGTLIWGGMYCSEYTIDPASDAVMMIYTNVHPYAHYGELVRKFRVLVYQAME
ncbi:MAG: serine hydrolase domain-containing protein [Bacteroidia bacterium]|nr:serine hydrolase domain-containing protein [Bacteroidia bacterium]